MTAYLAIVKLTCRSAIRSHIFRLLLILLLLSIFLLPQTLIGDGTPKGDVQLFLQYCLGFAGFILCVSSVWLACSEVSSDVETAQLHMIAVKPVRRVVVLLGKYTGVVLIHLALLLIAAIVIYVFLSVRLSSSKFTEEDRALLDAQVLTARAVYAPERPDFNLLAQQELDRRIAAARERGQSVEQYQDDQRRREAFYEIRRELIATRGLIEENDAVFWQFSGLPDDLDDEDIVFLRYTVYVNRYYTQNQNAVRGQWLFTVHYARPDDDGGETVVSDMAAMPEDDVLTATRNEMPVPIRTSFFIRDGRAELGFLNKDTTTAELNFEEGKGPFLLIRVAGFFSNYCRTILALAIGIVSITLLAASVAACLSLPIAIFFTAAYMLTGGLAHYVVSSLPDTIDYQAEFTGEFGYRFGRVLLTMVVPLQDFFVTGRLASGELVSFGSIGGLFAMDVIVRTVPVFLFGAWIYTRRELALASKRG